MRLWHKHLLFLALPVIVFFLLSYGNLSLSGRQYAVFPFAIASVLFVFGKGRRWFGIAFIITLPIMVLGTRFVFSLAVSKESNGILLFQLERDASEASTLRLREQIDRYASTRVRVSLERYFRTGESLSEIRDLFPNATAVLWGTPKAVRLSFLQNGSPVSRYPLQTPMGERKVQLIEHIQGVDLPIEPVQQTGLFIARMLEMEFLKDEPENRQALKALLKSTAHHISDWDSRSHLAVPWLRLANMSLIEGYEGNKRGSAKKALRGYSQAAAYLEPYVHPELRAAIFNNKAVALLLMGNTVLEDRDYLKKARSLLQKARIIARRPSIWPVPRYVKQTIRRNLRVVDALSGKKIKERGKKHEI
ncbi:MAG: hypothetical protein ACO3XO_04440 [Bdellovibrionota bacterium]